MSIRDTTRSRLARYVFGLFREEIAGMVDRRRLMHPLIFGDASRLSLAGNNELNNATINLMSGDISIGCETFFGFGVSLLTGTHDTNLRGEDRRTNWPKTGRNITIGDGVWIGSNATIIGPCIIGDDAVVAAGAVVTRDVPPATVVAGIPARFVRGA